jgi:hypothetical protein
MSERADDLAAAPATGRAGDLVRDPAAWSRATAAPSRVALLHAVEDADSEFAVAVAVLGACGVSDWASLPVGVIDRLLLRAHRAVLHRDLEVAVGCPECGTLNGLPLGPGDVPEYAPRTAWCGPGAGVREPTGADLVGLPDDADAAAAELETRCLTGPAGSAWSSAAGTGVAAAFDVADQSLCGPVRVACVACGGPVTAYVDVQHLVTAAITDALAGVDVEIHLIASRYGWELATIESLGDARRARLAVLAGGGQ